MFWLLTTNADHDKFLQKNGFYFSKRARVIKLNYLSFSTVFFSFLLQQEIDLDLPLMVLKFVCQM